MVKAGAAAEMALYYAEKTEERLGQLAELPENRDRPRDELLAEARVAVRREAAARQGEDPEAAEATERAAIASERVGGSVAYYAAGGAVAASDTPDRQVWIRGDRAGDHLAPDALSELFLGSDAAGRRLDDPQLHAWNKLARIAEYSGEMTPEALVSLRGGVHPDTGEVLSEEALAYAEEAWKAPHRGEGAVTATDVTFSAPKAVSLLSAFGSTSTAEAVIAAQEAAVETALSWAEETGVITVRRGAQGAERLNAELGDVARVTEMTSREGDPQLHSHTILSAFVTGSDGRVSAIDGAVLMGASAAIDAAYRRALGQELERRLGISLDVDEAGKLSKVAGIDEELERRFSTRRGQINETLAERTKERERLERVMGDARGLYQDAYEARERHGASALAGDESRRAEIYAQWLESGTTPAAAALATRASKAEETEAEARARWAADSSIPDGEVLLRQAQDALAAREAPQVVEAEFHAQLGEVLTRDAERFSAKEAIAAGLHLAPAGVSHAEVVASVERWLGTGAVRLQAPEENVLEAEQVGDRWQAKVKTFTTPEVVAEQRRIVDMARKLTYQTVDAVKEGDLRELAELCESYGLSDDQEKLVSAVSTGQRLVVAEGPAGSGKSHVLGLVAENARRRGMQVTVLSTKADLAAELAAEVGADRGMSLQKATMRADDAPVHAPGAFESGWVAQGLSEDVAAEFYDWKRAIREADSPEQKAKAEAGLAAWAEALPTDKERQAVNSARSRLEWFDTGSMLMGDGQQRQVLHEKREQLREASAGDPGKIVKADFTEPHLFIVDEAAMSNNQHLERLLEHAAAHPDSQIVAVGDSAQLAAVGRAGGYRAMVDELGAVEMSETRRAKAAWEREAQLEMRGLAYDDSPETREAARRLATEYLAHGRIWHLGDEAAADAISAGQVDPQSARPELDLAAGAAASWWAQQRSENPDDVALVLTPTRRLQAQAAAEIQKHRYADPADPLTLEAASTTLRLDSELTQTARVGEPVMVRSNAPKKGLRNGMSGEITKIYRDGAVKVRLEDERGKKFSVKVDRKAIDEGSLGLAYTSTAHKAQGATVDRALYVHDVQSQLADRHMIYPSMTRGKVENQVLLAGGHRDDVMEQFAGAMCRSEAPAALRVVNAPADEEELAEVARQWPGIPAERREELVLALREQRARSTRDQQHELQTRSRARAQRLAQERAGLRRPRQAQGMGVAV